MLTAFSAQTPFDHARNISKLTPLSESFTELVNLAIAAISDGHQREALSILDQMKDCIAETKNILDGRPTMLLNHLTRVKVLQYENCGLRLQLARLHNDEEETFVC